jgi:hypothetical protein
MLTLCVFDSAQKKVSKGFTRLYTHWNSTLEKFSGNDEDFYAFQGVTENQI